MDSSLLRLRVRSASSSASSTGKVIVAELGSTTLKELIRRAAEKLDMVVGQQQLGLYLDGKYLIEDIKELCTDDELVLKGVNVMEGDAKVKKEPGLKTKGEKETNASSAEEEEGSEEGDRKFPASVSSSNGGEEEEEEEEEEDDDSNTDDEVVDVTEEMLERREEEKKKSVVDLSAGEPKSSNDQSKGDESTMQQHDDEDEDDESSPDDGDADSWDNFESEDDDDDEKSWNEGHNNADFDKEDDRKPPAKRAKVAKHPALDIQIAKEHLPSAPGMTIDDPEYEYEAEVHGACKTDSAVKNRIVKLLNTGFHENSNENEAKNAMKLAQKLMKRHNLSQALLLKERDQKTENDSGRLKGGLVLAKIVNRKTGKPARGARWFSPLANAVCTTFEVQYYIETFKGFTFYGIYTNAQLAAYAFKVAAERISSMMEEYKRTTSSAAQTRAARLWYALGICNTLVEEAEAAADRAEKERKRKLEKARMAVSNPNKEAYDVSDASDDEDDWDFPSSFADDNDNDADKRPCKTNGNKNECSGGDETTKESTQASGSAQAPCAKKPTAEDRLRQQERNNTAALALVDHRTKVEEEVLKEEGIKLSKGRRQSRLKRFDSLAYEDGKEDAKEIDLKQRAIHDDWRKKVKKEK